jgi:hypothetical protein
MTGNCVIACQRVSFTKTEKQEYEEVRNRIFAELVRIEELENGYRFILHHYEGMLYDVTQWIPLEHKCCPFLIFSLAMYQDEFLRLELSGPVEIKAFLLYELNLS